MFWVLDAYRRIRSGEHYGRLEGETPRKGLLGAVLGTGHAGHVGHDIHSEPLVVLLAQRARLVLHLLLLAAVHVGL